MKVALCSIALVASASAFAPQVNNARTSVQLNAESSRREAMAKFGAAAAAFFPVVANAAVGESPRFSVFGVLGDGSSYSEGAAYGSDQSTKVYSPYSVYGERSEASVYKETDEVVQRKKAVLAESRLRLQKLPTYIEKKQWSNVTTELTRYMYETRGAVRYLAKTEAQKEKANAFFQSIEKTSLSASRKNQEACAKAAADSLTNLDKFVASVN